MEPITDVTSAAPSPDYVCEIRNVIPRAFIREKLVLSTSVTPSRARARSIADTTLKAATQFWFAVSVVGQWIFLFYLLAFYGPSSLTGNFQAWRKNAFPIRSYVAGDTAGNLAFATHVLLAAVIVFGGGIQLMPKIRSRFIAVHRWIGRVFLVTAMALSFSGLYLMWTRNHVAATRIASSSNALLIVVFSLLAWRSAIRHEISDHRRWALRTYMVTNSQWFGRVGIFAWILMNGGPVGLGNNFDGPVAVSWQFGCYLVPLAVLELYVHAKESASRFKKFALASALVGLTFATAAGMFGVTMAGWLPSVKAAFDGRKSIAETLSNTITTQGIDQASKLYHDLKATKPAGYNFAEKELNTLGHDLARTGRLNEAIRIFQLNAEAYPTSSNAYASLAEAYMESGKKPEALAYCQKSLQLDPKNKHALRVLQKLNVS